MLYEVITKIDVDAMALPMIGIGMALRLSGVGARRGAAGNALAGFGVLFLGISFLQQSISGTDRLFDPAALNSLGGFSVVAFVLAGLLLTTLMQSSRITSYNVCYTKLLRIKGCAARVSPTDTACTQITDSGAPPGK